MRGSFRLGQAFGIGIFVHWSFALLIGYVLVSSLAAGAGWVLAYNAVVFIVAVFACVVLHELGHCLAARRYGIGTHDITLLPIGGVARLMSIPEDPRQELVIAIAGPAVNVLIAALLSLFAFLAGLPNPGPQMALSSDAAILYGLIYANVVLVIFNMIPAFPMDGGRVFRALLALRTGPLRATEIAAKVGRVLAVVMFIGGFYLNPFLFLTAIFVFLAGSAELQAVRERHRSPGDGFPEPLHRALGPFVVEGGYGTNEPRRVRGRVIDVP